MKHKENIADWVQWSLLNIKTRKVAMIYVIVLLIIAVIFVPLGVKNGDPLIVIFIGAPLLMWLAIRWLDKNSAWKDHGDSQQSTETVK